MNLANIFLAVPHSGHIVTMALPGIMTLATPEKHRVFVSCNQSSLLALNFNCLWAKALNSRKELVLTHFAMHHADIAAPEGWLDTLVQEMDRVGADVLSAVVPIKDGRGITSTGIMTPTGDIRRLTMREVMNLPVTFELKDVPVPNKKYLLVNSGLWLCRFDTHWPASIKFTIEDCISQQPDGKFTVKALSEDWRFSRDCAQRGLRVFATRIVPVKHFGLSAFSNDCAWGEWASEQGDGTTVPPLTA
jgi:hypothetical protein